MAKKKQFANEVYLAFENNENYTINFESIEKALDYLEPKDGETIEVAVYKLEKVVRVKKESSFKIIK